MAVPSLARCSHRAFGFLRRFMERFVMGEIVSHVNRNTVS